MAAENANNTANVDDSSATPTKDYSPPPSYMSATKKISESETLRKPSTNMPPITPPPAIPPRRPDLLQTYGDSPVYETAKIEPAAPVAPPRQHSAKRDSKCPSSLMKLNISGTPFVIPKKSLLRHPTTFLGAIAGIVNSDVAQTQCDVYIPDTDEYYFERSPLIFEQVLGFYRHGIFHVPDVCPDEFLTEILFWRLRPEFIAECCKDRIPNFLWQYHKNTQIHKMSTHVTARKRIRDPFVNARFGRTRKRLWRMLVKPWHSRASKIFSSVAILFIILTVLTLTIHSYTKYQMPNHHHRKHLRPSENASTISPSTTPPTGNNENSTLVTDTNLSLSAHDSTYVVVNTLYFMCVIWITLEFGLRLFAAPKRRQFLKSNMAILDMVCIVTFYCGIFFYVAAFAGKIDRTWFLIVQGIQVLQIFRITRYSAEIRFLFYAIYKAGHQIFLFCVITGLLIVFFGVLLYSVELTIPDTEVTNIPVAIYWAFITVTTVGYGDIAPVSPVGRIVAMVATFAGVIILGFPISLVVSQFSDTYETEVDRKRRKRELICMTHKREASMYSGTATPIMQGAAFRPAVGGGSRRKSHFAGALGRQMFIVRRHGDDSESGVAGVNGSGAPSPAHTGSTRRRMSHEAIQKLAISRMSVNDINVIPKESLNGVFNEAFSGSESDIDWDSSLEYDEDEDDAFESPRTGAKVSDSRSAGSRRY